MAEQGSPAKAVTEAQVKEEYQRQLAAFNASFDASVSQNFIIVGEPAGAARAMRANALALEPLGAPQVSSPAEPQTSPRKKPLNKEPPKPEVTGRNSSAAVKDPPLSQEITDDRFDPRHCDGGASLSHLGLTLFGSDTESLTARQAWGYHKGVRVKVDFPSDIHSVEQWGKSVVGFTTKNDLNGLSYEEAFLKCQGISDAKVNWYIGNGSKSALVKDLGSYFKIRVASGGSSSSSGPAQKCIPGTNKPRTFKD